MRLEKAESQIIGHLLIILLIFILVVIILLYLLGMFDGLFRPGTLAPPIFKIISVFHQTPKGENKLASRVVVENTITTEFNNRDLSAVFYRNSKEMYAIITTLHGEDFIASHHFGVATIGGSGCRGDFFSQGEKIMVDLKNGYYRPGDLMELRIYERSYDLSLLPINGLLCDHAYMEEWVKENFYSTKKGYRLISQHKFSA